MAILEIGDWQTHCSACRGTTDWNPEGHMTQLGYDMAVNGTPGCLEPWTGVRFVGRVWVTPEGIQYPTFSDDDHFPQWMKELPLV